MPPAYRETPSPTTNSNVAAAAEDILRISKVADPEMRQKYGIMLNNLLEREYLRFQGTDNAKRSSLNVVKNRIIENMVRWDSMEGYFAHLDKATSGGIRTGELPQDWGRSLPEPGIRERQNIVLNLGEAGAEKLAFWLCTASFYYEKPQNGGSIRFSSPGAYAEGIEDISQEKKNLDPALLEQVKESIIQRPYAIPSSSDFAAQRYFGMTERGEAMEQTFVSLIAGDTRLDGLTQESQNELTKYVERNVKGVKDTYLSIFKEYSERGVVFTQEEQAAICFATATLGIGNGLLFAGELAAKSHLAPEAANEATKKISRGMKAEIRYSFSDCLGEWGAGEVSESGAKPTIKIGNKNHQIVLDEKEMNELLVFGLLNTGIKHGKTELKLVLAHSEISGETRAYLQGGAENALAYFEMNYPSYPDKTRKISKDAMENSMRGFAAFKEGEILQGWSISERKRKSLLSEDRVRASENEAKAMDDIVAGISCIHDEIARCFNVSNDHLQKTMTGGAKGLFTMWLNDSASWLTAGLLPSESKKLLEGYNRVCERWGRVVDAYGLVKTAKPQSMNRLSADYIAEASSLFSELDSFEKSIYSYDINDARDALLKGMQTALNVWTAVSILLPVVSITGSFARVGLSKMGITALSEYGKTIEKKGAETAVKTYFFSAENLSRAASHMASWEVQRIAIAQGIGFSSLNIYQQHENNRMVSRLREGKKEETNQLIGKMESLLPELDPESRKTVSMCIGSLVELRDQKESSINYIESGLVFAQAWGTYVFFAGTVKALNGSTFKKPGALNAALADKGDEIIRSVSSKPEELLKAGERIHGTKVRFADKKSANFYKILVSDADNLRGLDLGEGMVVGTVSMDKGGMWIMNGLDMRIGDAALNVYLESIEQVGKKYGAELVLSGGDEVIAIITSAKGGFGATMTEGQMAELCRKFTSDVADEMVLRLRAIGLDDAAPEMVKFFETMRKFEANSYAFSLEPNGATTLGGKRISVSKEMNFAEIEKSLAKLDKKSRKIAEKLMQRMPGEGVEQFTGPLKEGSVTLNVSMELDVDGKKLFGDLAEINLKGVRQASEGIVGPGVMNQAGHLYFDHVQSLFGSALAKNLEAHGITVRTTGPMKYAFFRVNETPVQIDEAHLIEAAFNQSKKEVIRLLNADGKIFKDAKFIALKVNADAIGRMEVVGTDISGFSAHSESIIGGKEYAKIQRAISLMHMGAEFSRAVGEDIVFDPVLKGWARTPEDYLWSQINKEALNIGGSTTKGVVIDTGSDDFRQKR